MADIYYFGCRNLTTANPHTGHFWLTPHQNICSPILPRDLLVIDGKYTPSPREVADSGRFEEAEVEGTAAFRYRDGWTILAYWDRSVDRRFGSNSAFLIKGFVSEEVAVAQAKEHYPWVFERQDFPLRIVLRDELPPHLRGDQGMIIAGLEEASCGRAIPVIGISGRKRAGKDTIGQYLEQRGFVGESFATPLKQAVRAIYGWTRDHTDGPLKEVIDPYWGVTPRWVMQRFGTEMAHNLDPRIWSRALHHRISQRVDKIVSRRTVRGFPEPPFCFYVSDVRFPNEGDIVRQWGGVIIRVERPGVVQGDLHSSETVMDSYEFDYVLSNDGDIAHLHDQVEAVLTGRLEQSGEVQTVNGPRRIRRR